MTLSDRLRRTKDQRRAELRNRVPADAPLQEPARSIKVRGAPKHGATIAVIPDVQVKPDVPINHLVAAGRYIADRQPQVIVCIGDFADMPSLSVYDKPGSEKAEGKRYQDDIDSTHYAMDALLTPISKVAGYNPQMIMTLGNHEDRIDRAISADPKHLRGVIGLNDLRYREYGWNVVPFLQPIIVNGVAFCHYFPSGIMGRPITSAAGLLRTLHMSAYAGHQQGKQVAGSMRADGHELTAIISGSFYQHNEDYLSPFANRHWRGMYFLHEVKNGTFDEMPLSMNYLLRRFG